MREPIGDVVARRYSFEQFANRHVERAGDTNEDVGSRIGLRAFNPPKMPEVDPRALRHRFLREPLIQPEMANLLAQQPQIDIPLERRFNRRRSDTLARHADSFITAV